MCISKEKMSVVKAPYYMVATLWHSGKGKTVEKKKGWEVARGLGGEGQAGWSTDGLQGGEAALCETVMVDTRHHTFVRPTECKLCRLRTLCGIDTYQYIPVYRYWFSNYNKHTDVNNRGRNVWGLEDRGHVGTLYFVTSFSVKLSLL